MASVALIGLTATRAAAAVAMNTPRASSSAAVTTTTGVTAGAWTHVRSGPSTTAGIVTVVKAGTRVSGTEVHGWLKISSPTGFSGKYIAISTLKAITHTTSTPAPPPPAPARPPVATGTLKTPFACPTRPSTQLATNGPCVQAAQYILNSWIMRTGAAGTQMLAVSGVLDDVTRADLKAFQSANKLPATGTADTLTWNALAAASSATSTSTIDAVTTGQTHLAFPSAIRLTDGRLMVVFRSAMGHFPGPNTRPSMYKIYSSDGGYTWTTPVQILLPNGMTNTPAGLGIATSGPLKGRPILTTWSASLDPVTGKNLAGTATSTYVSIANDLTGDSWGALTDIHASPSAAASTFSASPIVQVGDTTFQQAVYSYTNQGPSTATVPLTFDGHALIAGAAVSIAVAGQVEPGIGYDESGMVKLHDGRLLALVRDASATTQASIWKSYSSDGGRTWSTPSIAFAGSGAPRMSVTGNGTVVVLYRNDVNPGGVQSPIDTRDAMYVTSTDGGATWSTPRSVGAHSLAEMTYGTPVVNPDGTITFIYGSESDGYHSTLQVTGHTHL